MRLRVTQAFSQESFLRNLANVRAQRDAALGRMSSGQRVRFPSDDATATRELVRLSDRSSLIDSRLLKIKQARPQLNMTEKALSNLNGFLERARTLAIQASNETYDDSQRDAMRTQLQGIRAELEGLARTRVNGAYIFSGTRTDVEPYDGTGAYQGNNEKIEITLDNRRLQLNMTADQVFGQSGVGGPLDIIDRFDAALVARDTTAIQNLTDEFGTAIEENSSRLAQVGTWSESLLEGEIRLEQEGVETSARASDVGAADMAEAISDVARFDTGYQATLAAGARLYGPTFFDFLG